MFHSGTSPVTRQLSSKLSSRYTNQTNELSVCEKTSAGDSLHLGPGKLFFMLFNNSPSLFLVPFFFFHHRGYSLTHFEKENISYQLALRQGFVFFSQPTVGRTLINSRQIMFFFRCYIHSNSWLKAEDGRSLLIGNINHKYATWVSRW